MSKELRALLDSINTMKDEVKALYADGKDAEAEAKMDALEAAQAKFENLMKLEDDTVVPQEPKKPVQNMDPIHMFAEAARHGFKNTVDPMNEGTNADGGYTVPEDIQTRINKYKETHYSLRQLVSVENVKTNKGARTYQSKAKAPGFQKVDENGAVQQISGPKFERITYTIEDYGGYLPVTNDLLNDSDANIAQVIIDWIGQNSLVTDNAEILAILQGKDATEFTGIADIKKAINVTLGQAYKGAVKIVTNDDGLNYLDTLEDANKRPLLNPNPTEPNAVQLRVGATVYPIDAVPNNELASAPVYEASSDTSVKSGKTYYTRSGSGTTESPYVYTAVASPTGNPSTSSYYELTKMQYPFIVGDLFEAAKIFDRQQTTILSSNVASVTGYNAFEQRGQLFRADARMDYEKVDEDAWVNGYIEVSLGE